MKMLITNGLVQGVIMKFIVSSKGGLYVEFTDNNGNTKIHLISQCMT